MDVNIEYDRACEFLFTRLAAFHRIGAGAYKPGLDTTLRLSDAFGAPHRRLRVIHIGGTNGKGSVSHTIASVLQCAGYRTGLYTSPHLLDFTERIRVDGQPIPRQCVVDFVHRFREMDIDVDPSFFELATVMAMDHFVRSDVDVAVIEVGLGGRLDSTNIVTPDLSIVTNISPDHTGILGDTRAEIAAEKAGIFKPGIHALVGEDDAEVRPVFEATARRVGAPLCFAGDSPAFDSTYTRDMRAYYRSTPFGDICGELSGACQAANANTILKAVLLLNENGYDIPDRAVADGFAGVTSRTGLMGRWQIVSAHPRIICDTGHNPGAWQYLGPALDDISHREGTTLHIVVGFVNDKDISTIIGYWPSGARYYFVMPSTPRAASAGSVAGIAAEHAIYGTAYATVREGLEAAVSAARDSDTVFVGGSTFVVADALAAIQDGAAAGLNGRR